jgi:hypothetical protein
VQFSGSCPVSASVPVDLIQFLSWHFVMILFSSHYGYVVVLCNDLLFSSSLD